MALDQLNELTSGRKYEGYREKTDGPMAVLAFVFLVAWSARIIGFLYFDATTRHALEAIQLNAPGGIVEDNRFEGSGSDVRVRAEGAIIRGNESHNPGSFVILDEGSSGAVVERNLVQGSLDWAVMGRSASGSIRWSCEGCSIAIARASATTARCSGRYSSSRAIRSRTKANQPAPPSMNPMRRFGYRSATP